MFSYCVAWSLFTSGLSGDFGRLEETKGAEINYDLLGVIEPFFRVIWFFASLSP
jgi:hypothetical protein